MNRLSTDLLKTIPTAASICATIVSIVSGFFLANAYLDLKRNHGIQFEVERLIKHSEEVESRSQSMNALESTFLVACIGEYSKKCDPYRPDKSSVAHGPAEYKIYKCGSDLQDIVKNFCPKGQIEKSLIRSKPGDKCGYTEIFLSCDLQKS